MNPDTTKLAANLLRAHASRMRQCGEPWPGVSDELDQVAAGLDRGTIDFALQVDVDDSLWKLSPSNARAEVTRRLHNAVQSGIARRVTLDDRLTRYTRYLTDGTEAPPEAAGKRIGKHSITASFAVLPIPAKEP